MSKIERHIDELEEKARQRGRGDIPAIVFNDPELAEELKERGEKVRTFSIGGLDLEEDV